jgi:hypothetical protein
MVPTSEDQVREMIHRFNELGIGAFDPQWAGGRLHQITTNDETVIAQTAQTRAEKLGQPFTRWSARKLVAYVADNTIRVVTIGRERLRQLLVDQEITFQRTKTWKESNDPARDANLNASITWWSTTRPGCSVRRVRPCEHPNGAGLGLGVPQRRPQPQPANYHRTRAAVPRLLLRSRRTTSRVTGSSAKRVAGRSLLALRAEAEWLKR